MASPLVVRSVEMLRETVRAWKQANLTVGLVPTMGALHDGHLSLVRQAKARCDRCVATLFVNPKQFAAHEDLGRYPRDEAGDAAKLSIAGCDLLFAPPVEAMYPTGFATAVSVTHGVSEGLESDSRPHFFGGVATVVAKLLIQAEPDVAVFGEKDYQQLLVIKRMAADLDLPVEIAAGATVREEDGLAMSSRNAYLSDEQRRIACALYALLSDAARTLSERMDASILERTRLALSAAGFDAIEYVELRDAETLAPIQDLSRSARLLAAVRLGATRLIDNVPVGPSEAQPIGQ